jgi:membrane protein CcdC involved in cytochrome C biogenesis
MTEKSFVEYERKSLEKMKRYQLPNKFKKIGVGIIIVSLVAFFVNKFSIENIDLKLASKYGILVGLLLISISKEKVEDELSIALRMQSYTFAFIAGVIITLLTNPLFNYIKNLILDKQPENFEGVGDWQVLWTLLSLQVFYFEFLKRMNK